MINLKNKQNGFVALISAIIIAFMLLAITLTAGLTSIFGRFNVLDAESKEHSSSLAEACGDSSILEVTYGTYSNNKLIHIGPNPSPEDDCSIITAIPNKPTTGQTLIKTQSVVNKAYTNIMIAIDSDYNIVSWDECQNFTASDSSC